MSIEVGTFSDSGTNSLLRRLGSTTGVSCLNAKNNYTVLFRLYVLGTNPVDDWLWVLGNSNSGTTGINRAIDYVYQSSTGLMSANAWITASGTNTVSSTDMSTGWYTIGIVRSSSTAMRIYHRIGTGSLIQAPGTGPAASDVSTRSQDSIMEWIFGNGLSGNNMAAGCRVMNYKSWTRALNTTQMAAEDLQITVADSTNLFSVSPMTDTAVLANNLTATGGATAWTAGSGLIAGINDPAVAFGGPFGLTQSGDAPVLGAISVAGNLGITQTRWQVPTNAAPGTAVYVHVYSGSRAAGFTLARQGNAVVQSDGTVSVPGSGVLGSNAFAVVHNYNDVPTVVSIYGGPAIATSILA